MKRIITKDTTNEILNIFIPDSASTNGAGKTGIVYNSLGLTCYYVRPGSAPVQLSLVTQTVTGAHTDGGFVEIDSTNLPGFYRLDIADAIIASGVDGAVIGLKGASGMAPVNIEIQLIDFDLNTATPEVTVSDKTGFSLSSAGVTAIRQEMDSNSTQLADIIIDIAALNNISTEQVLLQVSSALNTYDPPTKAELDSAVSGLATATVLADVKTKTDALPSGIKKGVAISNLIFIMRDSTDHFTGKEGLTVTGQIIKDSGSFASLGGTISEIGGGAYRINTISSAETNADIFTLKFSASGADDCFIEVKTV